MPPSKACCSRRTLPLRTNGGAAALIDLVRADHDDLRTAWRLEADRLPAALPAPYSGDLFDHVVWFVGARDGRARDVARSIEAAVRRADNGVKQDSDDAPAQRGVYAARTVLMLPATDPNLAQDLGGLRLGGAQNLGFYPDDPVHERPAVDALRAVLSLKTFPDDDDASPTMNPQFIRHCSDRLMDFTFYYPLFMAYVWMVGAVNFFFRFERAAVGKTLPPVPFLEPLSVIIPMRNEARHARETVEFALALNYPVFEVNRRQRRQHGRDGCAARHACRR